MRYRIRVNNRDLMEVQFISDAAFFLRDRLSLGMSVIVTDQKTGREYDDLTAEEIVEEVASEVP